MPATRQLKLGAFMRPVSIHTGGLDAFAEQVVPELQRRGIFPREYEGRTLRENLGLARPATPVPAAGPRYRLGCGVMRR